MGSGGRKLALATRGPIPEVAPLSEAPRSAVPENRSGSALHPAMPMPISATPSARPQIRGRGNPDTDDMAHSLICTKLGRVNCPRVNRTLINHVGGWVESEHRKLVSGVGRLAWR
jgi:hypothetical protein